MALKKNAADQIPYAELIEQLTTLQSLLSDPLNFVLSSEPKTQDNESKEKKNEAPAKNEVKKEISEDLAEDDQKIQIIQTNRTLHTRSIDLFTYFDNLLLRITPDLLLGSLEINKDFLTNLSQLKGFKWSKKIFNAPINNKKLEKISNELVDNISIKKNALEKINEIGLRLNSERNPLQFETIIRIRIETLKKNAEELLKDNSLSVFLKSIDKLFSELLKSIQNLINNAMGTAFVLEIDKIESSKNLDLAHETLSSITEKNEKTLKVSEEEEEKFQQDVQNCIIGSFFIMDHSEIKKESIKKLDKIEHYNLSEFNEIEQCELARLELSYVENKHFKDLQKNGLLIKNTQKLIKDILDYQSDLILIPENLVKEIQQSHESAIKSFEIILPKYKNYIDDVKYTEDTKRKTLKLILEIEKTKIDKYIQNIKLDLEKNEVLENSRLDSGPDDPTQKFIRFAKEALDELRGFIPLISHYIQDQTNLRGMNDFFNLLSEAFDELKYNIKEYIDSFFISEWSIIKNEPIMQFCTSC